jgi:circadian clock protein KaiC
VFLSFEESAVDLTANVASLGFDLARAEADGKLVIDHIKVVHGEVEHTGDWDLDGLFLRLGAAIDAIGAKRVVITRSRFSSVRSRTPPCFAPSCNACLPG